MSNSSEFSRLCKNVQRSSRNTRIFYSARLCLFYEFLSSKLTILFLRKRSLLTFHGLSSKSISTGSDKTESTYFGSFVIRSHSNSLRILSTTTFFLSKKCLKQVSEKNLKQKIKIVSETSQFSSTEDGKEAFQNLPSSTIRCRNFY